jgi:hypothetical protein
MLGVVRDDDLTLRVRGSHQEAASNHYILWNFIVGTFARMGLHAFAAVTSSFSERIGSYQTRQGISFHG